MVSIFVVGAPYTREDIAARIGMPDERRGGQWNTGYDEWNGEFFIFANVGVAGRTGHDYQNRWLNKDLSWFGRTHSKRGQPQVDRLISNTPPVHIFWRGANRGAFTYAGVGTAMEASDDMPIEVLWSFGNVAAAQPNSGPESVPIPATWRRGPPPVKGTTVTIKADGPTDVYVFKLGGTLCELLDVPVGHVAAKVGISNEIDRRLRELNAGFPPGSKLNWVHVISRTMSNAEEAFALEGECLERLRRDGLWIGGEFAVVPHDLVHRLLD